MSFDTKVPKKSLVAYGARNVEVSFCGEKRKLSPLMRLPVKCSGGNVPLDAALLRIKKVRNDSVYKFHNFKVIHFLSQLSAIV